MRFSGFALSCHQSSLRGSSAMVLFFQGILTCFMLAVIYFDLTRYIIPNWMVGVLLVLYPVMLFTVPVPPDWMQALWIGLGAFAIGFIIFSLRLMGGGDVKLLTVCCVWIGLPHLIHFIMYTALLGGVLSLALLLLRPAAAWSFARMKHPPAIPRLLTIGEPVPYGIAIALAFLFILWVMGVPGLPAAIVSS